jgi:hypothetical protein
MLHAAFADIIADAMVQSNSRLSEACSFESDCIRLPRQAGRRDRCQVVVHPVAGNLTPRFTSSSRLCAEAPARGCDTMMMEAMSWSPVRTYCERLRRTQSGARHHLAPSYVF